MVKFQLSYLQAGTGDNKILQLLNSKELIHFVYI